MPLVGEPRFLVAANLAEGSLRRPLPAWEPEARRVYAVFAQQSGQSPKVREFMSFLVRSFAADPEWEMDVPGAPAGLRRPRRRAA